MSTYQILSYVCKDAARRPVLCAWYGSDPQILGLGATADKQFNPWPFVFAFPEEADQVWVFAEWVTSLRALLQDGAAPEEVRDWLAQSTSTVLTLQKQGAADDKALALKDLPAVIPSSRGVRAAMKFLLLENGFGRIRDAASSDDVAVESKGPDLVVCGSDGSPQMSVEIKTWPAAPSDWAVELAASDGSSMNVKLGDPDATSQLQVWLATVRRSPSLR